MSEAKDLYNLKLHDFIEINPVLVVRRVPGGWIYETAIQNGGYGYSVSTCFVPYDNGFDERTLSEG